MMMLCLCCSDLGLPPQLFFPPEEYANIKPPPRPLIFRNYLSLWGATEIFLHGLRLFHANFAQQSSASGRWRPRRRGKRPRSASPASPGRSSLHRWVIPSAAFSSPWSRSWSQSYYDFLCFSQPEAGRLPLKIIILPDFLSCSH